MMKSAYPDRPFAAVSMVIFKDDKVLLIRRGKEPDKGKLSIPGGRIELGETIMEAALRETKEECGIEIELIAPMQVSEFIRKDEEDKTKFHNVIINFVAIYVSGEVEAGDDADEAFWSPVNNLPEQLSSKIIKIIIRSQEYLYHPDSTDIPYAPL